jgi:hypothetical protein
VLKASSIHVILNEELGRLYVKRVVTCVNEVLEKLPGRTEENMKTSTESK